MKRKDLEKCLVCGQGLMKCGSPMFYKIKIESMILDLKEIQQTAGLEQFFGGGVSGAVLADVMGPDPDLAKKVISYIALICMKCTIGAIEPARLFEMMSERVKP